jgi:SagB-type dehydrogenase family enzyme
MRHRPSPDAGTSIPVAELFHENSKLPPRISGQTTPANAITATDGPDNNSVKVYRTGLRIALPAVESLPVNVSAALARRRSVRSFGARVVTLGHVGQLLGWSHGVMPRAGADLPSGRTAPSAGALYPIELYVAAQGVPGAIPGVYHYNATDHELEGVTTEGGVQAVHRTSMYPEIANQASLMVMMVAVFARTCQKYGERGYRFVLLDCGHVAQNLHLVAATIGLGSVGIGGFLDDELNDVLELDGVNEAVVHTIALGWPAP